MDYFRTKKISRYTKRELEKKVEGAKRHVKFTMERHETYSEEVDAALKNWGEWREALARKQDENRSVLDG